MSLLSVIRFYCSEFLQLSMSVTLIYVTLTVIGYGLVRFLPKPEQPRWPLYAPIFGILLITIIGLPLTFLFQSPTVSWAHGFFILSGLGSLVAFWQTLQSSSPKRLLFHYLKIQRLPLALCIVVPLMISTAMMTAPPHQEVEDIWGSGDFGAYWAVSDYLQYYPPHLEAYHAQTLFRSQIVEEHLTIHARLGCMVSTAFLSSLYSFPGEAGHVHQVMIPYQVTSLILILLLLLRWLEDLSFKYSSLHVYAPLLTYPFLYFLLYFTYLSQALGVVLLIPSLLLLKYLHQKSQLRASMGSGLLAGAALLNYPNIALAIAISGLVILFQNIRYRNLITGMLWGLATLIATSYYIPDVLRELLYFSQKSSLPGWNWRSTIGSLEFLGFRSVMGYDLPYPRSGWISAVDTLLLILLPFFLYTGLKAYRNMSASLAVTFTFLLMYGLALQKVASGIPHSSHAIVKVVSLFSPWLFLLTMVPLIKIQQVLIERKWRAPIVTSMMLIMIGLHLATLSDARRQAPLFKEGLVQLAERQREHQLKGRAESELPIHFEPKLYYTFEACLLKNTDKLHQPIEAEGNEINETPYLMITKRTNLNPAEIPFIIDQQGDYVAIPSTSLIRP